jgi:hypothetical protein
MQVRFIIIMPMSKLYLLSLLAFAWLLPLATDAHQPQYVAERTVVAVEEPEVSKAYYGSLNGQPATYTIDADEPFDLYAGLIVPVGAGAETDFVLEIVAPNDETLFSESRAEPWPVFHEEFANDNYYDGPEFWLPNAPAGLYVIRISSPDNRGQYVLAVGKKEVFAPADVVSALRVIPQLKSDFFNKSGFSFAASVFGAPLVVLTVIFGALIGFVYRRILKRFKRSARQPHTAHRNIGNADRILRLALGLVLLVAGIYFWRLGLMAAAGFVFYEAASRWCVLYSAIGRNTCPL